VSQSRRTHMTLRVRPSGPSLSWDKLGMSRATFTKPHNRYTEVCKVKVTQRVCRAYLALRALKKTKPLCLVLECVEVCVWGVYGTSSAYHGYAVSAVWQRERIGRAGNQGVGGLAMLSFGGSKPCNCFVCSCKCALQVMIVTWPRQGRTREWERE